MSRTQLRELAEPFPKTLVKKAPKGKYGDYVPHSTVTERLLQVLGPYDFHITQVIRGTAPEIKTSKQTFPGRADAIVGVIARLTVSIDGRLVSVEEVGSEDNPAMHNDGENLKNATSDALKRCAMRLGCGLHLWSQDAYFLDRQLDKDHPPTPRESAEEAPQGAARGKTREAPEAGNDGADLPRGNPDGIGPERAKRLAATLAGEGIPAKQQLQFAAFILGRAVESLASVTEAEGMALYQEASALKGNGGAS